MPPRPDRDLYRFLVELAPLLRPIGDVDKLLRAALRATLDHFEAVEGAVALRRRSVRATTLAFALPAGASFDLALLDAFIRRRDPDVPRELLLAPVRRRGLPWGVLALRRPGDGFAPGEGRALARVTGLVNDLLTELDRERVAEVRARIDRKIMEELRPKDLFYQLLHGLRSLTHYDHSSALLVAEGDRLHLAAEQIAWRKGKSLRIGLALPLRPGSERALAGGSVFSFDRLASGWVERRGLDADGLADLLDYNSGGRRDDPRDEEAEGAFLCAPLVTADGLFGVLKVAAREAGSFGAWDADLLARLVPQAAIAIQNARRAATLETRMLAAEKKHVMAELVRGVAHDINNALGSVVPLVQQMRSDLAAGDPEPKVLAEDLAQIETSLEVCRRIFGGMLAFARGAERHLGPADLRQAARNALAVLADGIDRRGIRLEFDLADGLPPLPGPQGDLEQVLLNLLTNARDATPEGGSIRLRARSSEPHMVEVAIEDTGAGIPEEILGRVCEPFFTTKPRGNGLGLSICRSIVWELGGELRFESRPGEGTRVAVRLPVHDPARRPGSEAAL